MEQLITWYLLFNTVIMAMRPARLMWVISIVILIAALIAPSSAQGFSTVENDIEYRFDYPVEVKTSTCFTVNFWIKAQKTLANLVVSLSIFYHENSGVRTLYSDTILSSDVLQTGSTTSKSISVCLPRARPAEPYLRAKMEFYYNGSRRLSHEFYMSIVRAETYAELESQVSTLQSKVSILESRISALEKELDQKRQELSQLKEDYNCLLASYLSLKESYQNLKDDYQKLQEDYSRLQSSYESLSDKHQSTIIDLERMRTLYDSLARQFDKLEERYSSLLKDYESTLSELKTYKSMYEDLKAKHDDLRSRHDALIAEAAQLRQKLADLEEDYGYLNRVYEATLGESSLTKNILFAQTAAVAAGVGLYAVLSRKLTKKPRSPEVIEEGNGEKKIQKILSGRRVTIPSDAAARLGLKEGDLVEIDYGNGSIVIRPVERRVSEPKPEAGSNKVESESSKGAS
jgi:AbrB family looped-hinge helix DNA binding protein